MRGSDRRRSKVQWGNLPGKGIGFLPGDKMKMIPEHQRENYDVTEKYGGNLHMNSVLLEKCAGGHKLRATCMKVDFSHLGSKNPA